MAAFNMSNVKVTVPCKLCLHGTVLTGLLDGSAKRTHLVRILCSRVCTTSAGNRLDLANWD